MHTCSSLIFCCRRANECGVGRKAPSIDPCRRLFRESLGDKIGHSSKLTKWQGIDADVQTQRVFRLKPETRKCGRKVHYCLPDAINSGTKISLIHKSMQKLFLRHKNGKCLQKKSVLDLRDISREEKAKKWHQLPRFTSSKFYSLGNCLPETCFSLSKLERKLAAAALKVSSSLKESLYKTASEPSPSLLTFVFFPLKLFLHWMQSLEGYILSSNELADRWDNRKSPLKTWISAKTAAAFYTNIFFCIFSSLVPGTWVSLSARLHQVPPKSGSSDLWLGDWRILLLCIYIPARSESFDRLGRRKILLERSRSGNRTRFTLLELTLFRVAYPLDQRSFPI